MWMSVAWSYSSLSLFKQCPRKYHRLRIVKDIKEPPAKHLIYGNAVHKACEDYGKKGTPIPKEYEFVKRHVDVLLEAKGEKLFEYRMGLTEKLDPCKFFDKAVWWRGIADLVIINGDTALLVDYKTGKSAQYADTKQLQLLSLALFAHFKEVQTIKGGLLFLVSKEFVPATFTRDVIESSWTYWNKDVDRLALCIESDTWNPSENFTCRNWCAVTDCEYNGNN
tara:strand:- start:216 stop:884 length:669 start_codon:yes stop_codon:yes gene_type:complete